MKLTEKGININISGLKGWVKATVHINKFLIVTDKDITADIKEFSINGNIYVTTKRDENNKLIPYANFTEPPTYTREIEFGSHDIMYFMENWVESMFEKALGDAINNAFKNKYNELLNMALEQVKNLK